MTNLETKLLKILTREAVCFCSGAIWLSPAPLAQMPTASFGTFVNGFAKKRLTGPYRSYDKNCYDQQVYMLIPADATLKAQKLQVNMIYEFSERSFERF